MPLEYVFPDQSIRNHRIKVIAATVLAVAILIYIFYLIGKKMSPAPLIDASPGRSTTELQKIVSEQNPPAQLSQQQIQERQTVVTRPNPSTKLDTTELRQRQSILENI